MTVADRLEVGVLVGDGVVSINQELIHMEIRPHFFF